MAKQAQATERGSDLFATAIKTMLDQRAADDPLFAGVYKKENKSIEGCCNYIISEVQRMKVNALTDEEVLGLAVHYYDEDKIIAVTAPACEVVVPATPEIAEARKRELEAEAEKKRLGVALQLNLTLGNLEARPLQDVKEFYDEGEKMCHCVYSNEYYKRDDALIFTVRQNNKRLATVEVDINAFRVVQCRGKANSKPPRYNDIIRMFESAMPKIAGSVKRNQAI